MAVYKVGKRLGYSLKSYSFHFVAMIRSFYATIFIRLVIVLVYKKSVIRVGGRGPLTYRQATKEATP